MENEDNLSTFELLKKHFKPDTPHYVPRVLPRTEGCQYPVMVRPRQVNRMPKRLKGQVNKRCVYCETYVYVYQADYITECWLCHKLLKVVRHPYSSWYVQGVAIEKVD